MFVFANGSIFSPASTIYLFKVNNKKTGTRCETCSELTIKVSELRSGCVDTVSFGLILKLVLEFSLVTLKSSNNPELLFDCSADID